jgi:hypothetical protein
MQQHIDSRRHQGDAATFGIDDMTKAISPGFRRQHPPVPKG